MIDWYLETKENDLSNIEKLENEKGLIGKVLSKLVKVPFRVYVMGRVFGYTVFNVDKITI